MPVKKSNKAVAKKAVSKPVKAAKPVAKKAAKAPAEAPKRSVASRANLAWN